MLKRRKRLLNKLGL